MEGTTRCSANYIPLTPISFLERSALVYGDYVAALAPNIPAMYELHFGVPMAGAVLCTLNTRHDSAMVAVLLKHSEAKVIFVDDQFLDTAKGALEILSRSGGIKLPRLVVIHDSDEAKKQGSLEMEFEYESFLASGTSDFEIIWPNDECDPIAVTYTSGTTSTHPKGVVYSHRGAYLNALASILLNHMTLMPVYLWVVPMFHCNGWCLPWGVAAQGGTNICLRSVTAKGIFDNIVYHNVSHMGGAPAVLNMIINAPENVKRLVPRKVTVMTGGAPPPSHVLFKMEELGFEVVHSYGSTETYGPGTICMWKPEWNSLAPEARAKLKSRQGVHHIGMGMVDVKDPETMKSVPQDGKTLGEVMFRGNTVMNGYLKDLKATEAAFKGGWFRTGDLGVKHPDGYIEVKDRSKDIIVSGGKNISTFEIESVIFSHPAVLEVAVVGKPDDHRGETPCAFVKLKDGYKVSPNEIIKYCRDRLPHYMAPTTVVFTDLPKTSTGKTQKFILRQRTQAMGSLSISSRL
nr:probable acyl-activating enzyme 1, peroxisomal [Ipomoea batatas]